MKKILLVDDVKLFLSMEKTFLTRQNLQIFTATSGAEAIELHRREDFDVILLDLYMPEMNGDEVCKKIRSDSTLNKVSIIMVTTSSKKEDIDLCIASGANDYITKPIDAAELLKKVGKYVDIPHRQKIRALSRIEIKAHSGNRSFLAHTVNISVNGMLIESADKMNVSDVVEASLIIPGSFSSINVAGTVVRKVDNGPEQLPYYGIRLLNLTEKDREIIENYINKHQGKEMT